LFSRGSGELSIYWMPAKRRSTLDALALGHSRKCAGRRPRHTLLPTMSGRPLITALCFKANPIVAPSLRWVLGFAPSFASNSSRTHLEEKRDILPGAPPTALRK